MIDIAKIEAIAAQVAREELVELFDLELGSDGARPVVRVYLDREGGVTLGECESFSRKMSAALEVFDPVPGAYVLEVSSPGLNRKLRKPAHFASVTGRKVRLTLSEPVGGNRRFAGTLRRSDEDGIEIETDADGGTMRIGYAAIRKANLEVSDEELFGKGRKKQ
jgi:ribosome maturation factor RimP